MSIPHELSYYTRSDGVTIAYGTAGSGPPLILVPGWVTHLEYMWNDPASLLFAPLTDHVTLITYDKHGCGLSDRDRTEYTLASERLDVEELVDHLGLERFNLMGMSEGGTVAADYAAMHPDRVNKLVLYSCTAYGAGLAPEDFRRSFVDIIRASWGVGSSVITDMLAPNASKEQQAEFAQYQRDSAPAEVAASMMESLYSWDIRPELADIDAETLIIHRRKSRAFPPANGRDLAAGIPNSRAVIVDGFAHFPPEPGDAHTIDVVNEILGFVADGARATPVTDRSDLRTILFTDIEGSTVLVERLGDEKAREIMRQHDDICRTAVRAHGGTEIKSMGDGFMVSFLSASGAIDAAIEMQTVIADSFRDMQSPLRIRIGIHAGEPVQEGDDLHGTSVIRASRIMDLAEGDQIMVSSIVRELVAGKHYRFTNRGMHQLKGIDEQQRLFEVNWADPS
jgi:class 3 adenylate cyclase